MNLSEIEDAVLSLGIPRFRGRQLFDWLYKGVTGFEEMKNLPLELRSSLSESFDITMPQVLDCQLSKEDGTRKYLIGFSDGNAIETVFMKYKYGNSICVSSQAGCRMGCKFCASTLKGLNRNLTAGEILSQILTVQRETGERIGHIVVMGTGEPFDNYDNLSQFINLVHEPKGLNISMRNITVSTCGIAPVIRRFANDFPQVNLAISLHAPTDELRSSMMPINDAYPIRELIEAASEYIELTNRRITFEYTMVSGVNDGREAGEALVKLLKRLKNGLCHVNIIPLNKVKGSGFDTVSREKSMEFAEYLSRNGIQATVRRELGADIDAACGQLRLKGLDG